MTDTTPSLAARLPEAIADARARTLALVADLSDEQLMGPRLPILNPLKWEIAHVAWFQEKWVLRREGQPSVRADADALYDSMAVPHDVRWDLPLPSRHDTIAYVEQVRDRVLRSLEGGAPSADALYFTLLALFHEDMHAEAFTYARQTLGYPAPRTSMAPTGSAEGEGGPLPGDAAVPGGTLLLGAAPEDGFVFDNEKWAHPVEVAPFSIARAPVTQAEFAEFVD
ncbi:MAG TPA: DinB family protein, partial [Armatimonadota bacterium]|nr:DinB family protein [Armatimonadota bacterium]